MYRGRIHRVSTVLARPRRSELRGLPGGAVLYVLLLAATNAAADKTATSTGLRLLDDSLRTGVRVSVKGRTLADGTFRADTVELQESNDPDEELHGPVSDLDPEGRMFSVVGRTVHVRSKTRFTLVPERTARFEDLTEGMWVKVDGNTVGEGILRADKVRIDPRRSQLSRMKIEGSIQALEPSISDLAVMRVAGVPTVLTLSTELIGPRGGSRPIARGIGNTVDDDELQFTRNTTLGRYLSLAGEVRLRGERVSNLDLDDSTDDVELVPEIFAQFGFVAKLEPVYVFLTLTASREFFVRSEEPFQGEGGEVRVGQAYVVLPLARHFSLAIGRRRFDEEREWYYNTRNLDGVRLAANFHPVEIEASVSRNLFDETRNLRDQNRTNVILHARYLVARDVHLAAYFIDRDDRTALNDSPRTVGLRLLGDPGRHLEFWIDLARQTGTYCSRLSLDRTFDTGRRCSPEQEPATFNVRNVRAHAFDLGLTYRPRQALDPTFTISYALASGEDDQIRSLSVEEAAARTATSFHQTGFHRNRGKLNGVVSFRYYGEVMDPELTNLRVFTLGVGLRPISAVSIDAVFHDYRQDVASLSFHEFEIDDTPSGIDPDIGREWDLILGYEPTRRYELRLTAGRFHPGAAMDAAAEPASVVRFQAKFRF